MLHAAEAPPHVLTDKRAIKLHYQLLTHPQRNTRSPHHPRRRLSQLDGLLACIWAYGTPLPCLSPTGSPDASPRSMLWKEPHGSADSADSIGSGRVLGLGFLTFFLDYVRKRLATPPVAGDVTGALARALCDSERNALAVTR